MAVEKKKLLRIGLDLDGCLYDFANSFREYMCSINKSFDWPKGYEENTRWDFYKDLGLTSEEFRKYCNDGVDAGVIFRGGTRENAVEAAHIIKDLGHEIIVITDRQFGSSPVSSYVATVDWLEDNKIPFDELYFSADKTIAHTDMFVEDKIQNYDDLVRAGSDCYLINRPWNLRQDDRQRINDIIEYAWAVEAKTKSLVI